MDRLGISPQITTSAASPARTGRRFTEKSCESCHRSYVPSSSSQRYCPDCRSEVKGEKDRNWAIRNRERISAQGRARRAKDPEKSRVKQRAFYERNRERILATLRAERGSKHQLEKKCFRCDRPYVPSRRTQRYCRECAPRAELDRNRERAREWKQKQIKHLTSAELEECLQDPRKVWTIRGPEWIACPDCGELHKTLNRHIGPRHNMNAAEFKAQPSLDGQVPRFSKNASLMCLELRRRFSKKRKKLKLGERLQKSGKVPPIRKLIASRGKRVVSQQLRLERRETSMGAKPWLWGRHNEKSLEKKLDQVTSSESTAYVVPFIPRNKKLSARSLMIFSHCRSTAITTDVRTGSLLRWPRNAQSNLRKGAAEQRSVGMAQAMPRPMAQAMAAR
jgi:predicted transcriptional regulator